MPVCCRVNRMGEFASTTSRTLRSINIRLTRVRAIKPGCATTAPPLTAQGTPRIIAVGDIHGSIDGIKSILKITGLIDGSSKWIGGKTQLLQTGDYMDRGAGVRQVLDLLMSLEDQAKSAGGRAFALLGNHEVMNLIGETRDATPEIFANLGAPRERFTL